MISNEICNAIGYDRIVLLLSDKDVTVAVILLAKLGSHGALIEMQNDWPAEA